MSRASKSHLFAVSVLLFIAATCSSSVSQEASGQVPEVVLIPGGEFLMGVDGEGDCSPVHKVYVDSFYIDRCEVTNAEFEEFCAETGRDLPLFWGIEEFHCGADFPDHPVIGVTWSDATAYAEWKGMRLPTEAEWEYAARGGLVGKKFPSGDEIDGTMANYWRSEGTVPVGSYPPNGYGLHDMAGNVVEWVSDYYDEDYYKTSPSQNPTGPEDGRYQVIRGGGWHSGPSCNAVYYRNCLKASWVDFNVGFRCAKDLD